MHPASLLLREGLTVRSIHLSPLQLLSAVVLLGMLPACGGPETAPEATPGAAPGAADTPAATGAEPEAAAAGGVADLLTALEGLSVEERRGELIELAVDQGGQVNVYTSMNDEIAGLVGEAFEADTGVAMLTYRAPAEDVRTRILQEGQAGRSAADVAWIGDSRLVPIRDADLLTPYTSPYQEDLVEGSVSEYWTLNHHNIYTVAWNTDMVAEGEQPQSYEDLADPKWDGRMTMEPSDADWYWSINDYLRNDQGFSEEEIDQYWQDVIDGAEFNSGHTSSNQLLIAGRYGIFTSAFSRSIELEKVDGAPVEWQPPFSPVFATPEAAAIVASTTKPAGSVLFMDWLIAEGQQVLTDLQVDVTREDLQALDDLEIRFIDPEEWNEVEAEMIAEYQALTGG